MDLLDAARSLASRAAKLGLRSRTLTTDECRLLTSKITIYPRWLLDLLSTVPLCGLELEWQAYPPKEDFDGIMPIEVCDADGVLSESLEAYPGIAILPAGYINFGDGCGSGDPYFISVHEGEDPPLYQVYHDIGTEAEEILAEGRVVVSPQLSEFFQVAILTGE